MSNRARPKEPGSHTTTASAITERHDSSRP